MRFTKRGERKDFTKGVTRHGAKVGNVGGNAIGCVIFNCFRKNASLQFEMTKLIENKMLGD